MFARCCLGYFITSCDSGFGDGVLYMCIADLFGGWHSGFRY